MQELLEPRAGVHRISPPPSFFPVNLQKIYKAVEKLGASELVSRQRPPIPHGSVLPVWGG